MTLVIWRGTEVTDAAVMRRQPGWVRPGKAGRPATGRDSRHERFDRDVLGRARAGGGGEGGVGDQHRDRADPPRTPLRQPQAAVLVAAHLAAVDTATADQRLRHRAFQRADPVRHRAGPRLGHRRHLLPRRSDRLPVPPARPLRHRRGRHPHRPARHARVRPRRRGHRDRVPPAPGPHRRAGRTGRLRAAGVSGRMGRAGQACPGAARLPAQPHRAAGPETGTRSAWNPPAIPPWRPSPSRWT